MSDIYQIANVGLIDSKQRLEVIGMNAASASLPGFRRQVIAGPTFDAALSAAQSASVSTTDPSQPRAEIAAIPRHVNLLQSAMIATGHALDCAIEGNDNAFFGLTDGTQVWLTRAGSFHLNDENLLVGEGGLRVIGTDGDLRLPSADASIDAQGHITHDGLVVGALQIFRANDVATLVGARGALLQAPSGMQAAESVRVRSGVLEASNTDATKEMLSLMSLSRQFESLSRIVQSYDETLSRTMQRLGEN